MNPEVINSAIDNLIADARQLPELRREIKELKAINKEMYEALECACDKYCIGYVGDNLVKCDDCVIQKALRKARGETVHKPHQRKRSLEYPCCSQDSQERFLGTER